jgi:hypothetical protein
MTSVHVKVKMYVTDNIGVSRDRHCRRATLHSLSIHGGALYGDSEEEKEVLDECVDKTIVSCIY